jgi:hypothetical protein
MLAAMPQPCPSVRFEEGSLLRQRHVRLGFETRVGDKLETAYNAGLPDKQQRKEATFLKEKDTTLPIGHQRFDLLGPVGPSCLDLQAFGVTDTKKSRGTIRDMEAKMACGLEGSRDCVVVSLGSNGQWTFEEDVFARTGCRVEVFDCTVDPQKVTVPKHLRARVRLHYHCIGPPSRGEGKGARPLLPRKTKTVPPCPCSLRRALTGRIYSWPVRRFIDTTRELSFVSYARALRLAGIHSAPAFLKMDIEGYECVPLIQCLRLPLLMYAA